MNEAQRGLLVVGASEVVTMADGLRRGAAQDDPAIVTGEDPIVAIWDGAIAAVGPLEEVKSRLTADGHDIASFSFLDAHGGTVTPGLIDPHTHLLFGGTREGEIALRQRGASYLDVLAAGGGILSTVAATRAADEETLTAHGRRWLDAMLGHGVTTIEAKSGYGLDLPTELRLLRVVDALGREGPIEILPTFLGLHAVPSEYRDGPDGADRFVDAVVTQMLPAVAASGHARFCDVFCERGVFTPEQSRRFLLAGAALGLASRLHADELAPSGGAELAAEIGALSADHLAVPSLAGIEALARAAAGPRPVVAVVLPATTLFLGTDHHAPARTFIEQGVPVAVGTDFNPGTSPTANLPLALSLAVLTLRLSPAEALAAVTINAAHALGLGESHGSLERGKTGDLVVWDVPSHRRLPYWLGADLARSVVKRGRVVWTASPGETATLDPERVARRD
jgi:imidazolonepropionase